MQFLKRIHGYKISYVKILYFLLCRTENLFALLYFICQGNWNYTLGFPCHGSFSRHYFDCIRCAFLCCSAACALVSFATLFFSKNAYSTCFSMHNLYKSSLSAFCSLKQSPRQAIASFILLKVNYPETLELINITCMFSFLFTSIFLRSKSICRN